MLVYIYIYKVFVWIGMVLEIRLGPWGLRLAEVMRNICS